MYQVHIGGNGISLETKGLTWYKVPGPVLIKDKGLKQFLLLIELMSLTQKTPIINPNYAGIPSGTKLVGTDGQVYIKMKESNQDRFRWKLVRKKEMSANYQNSRMTVIKHLVKTCGTEKIPLMASLIGLPPFAGNNSNLKYSLWDQNVGSPESKEYFVFLLLKFLHFNQIDPIDLFKFEVNLGPRNEKVRIKLDKYIMTKWKHNGKLGRKVIVYRAFTKVYPNVEFKNVPDTILTPLVCYLLLKHDLVKSEVPFTQIPGSIHQFEK